MIAVGTDQFVMNGAITILKFFLLEIKSAFIYFIFSERVLLCNAVWPGTHCVDQAGPASDSLVLGLKASAWLPTLFF